MKLLTSSRIWAIGYVAVVFGLILSFYIDAQQDDRVTAAETEAAKSAAACVKKVTAAYTESTVAVREAAQDRDDALVGSKIALRELIRLRVIEQIGNSQQVQQAADQYMHQTAKFVEASAALDKARAAYPVPDPEKIC